MTESRQTRAPVGPTTPLQYVKGVGPHRAKLLERKGLVTVGDALFHLPMRHEDRTRFTPLRAIRPGETVTCSGVVTGISPPPPGRRRQPLVILLRDESGYATATVWGRPWIARAVQRGQRMIVHGRAGARGAPPGLRRLPAPAARARDPPLAHDAAAWSLDAPARRADRPPAREPALLAHGGAGARVGRHPARHGRAVPDAPAAAGRRRLGQDGGGGARRVRGGGGWLPGGGHGAHRDSRRAASRDLPPAARAARHRRDAADVGAEGARAGGAARGDRGGGGRLGQSAPPPRGRGPSAADT